MHFEVVLIEKRHDDTAPDEHIKEMVATARLGRAQKFLTRCVSR